MDYLGLSLNEQLVVAMGIGFLFAPWNRGMLPLVIVIIVVEFLMWSFWPTSWNGEIRAGMLLSGILGWIIGKTIIGHKIHKPGRKYVRSFIPWKL